jgi:hypothetical protein
MLHVDQRRCVEQPVVQRRYPNMTAPESAIRATWRAQNCLSATDVRDRNMELEEEVTRNSLVFGWCRLRIDVEDQISQPELVLALEPQLCWLRNHKEQRQQRDDQDAGRQHGCGKVGTTGDPPCE